MRVKLTWPGKGGGARPPPFTTITITSKVAVYALPIYVLCGSPSLTVSEFFFSLCDLPMRGDERLGMETANNHGPLLSLCELNHWSGEVLFFLFLNMESTVVKESNQGCNVCVGWRLQVSQELADNYALTAQLSAENLRIQGQAHGLINYKETKAKCRHLKYWPVKGLCGRCLS